jgi:23S rRNA (cytidine1920-2'-O)/16S rRNA (cytidine1409-2'-O)-methyltransferase
MSPRGEAGRQRLDVLLVVRGLAPSRVKAQALVLAGRVFSRGARLDKPGVRFPTDIPLELLEGPRYVSRGGYKLAAALERFGVEARDRDAMDVGSSTGGFTQVLLEAGARRVIAVDVGKGQLDFGLRRDRRVHVMEGVNARYLEPTVLPFLPSLAVVDVSFISLKLVLPAIVRCLEASGEIVALVKPQFEVGRDKVGRGGIVREATLHREVLESLSALGVRERWGPSAVCRSALRGAEGNQEYFLYLEPSRAGLKPAELARRIGEVTGEESEG